MSRVYGKAWHGTLGLGKVRCGTLGLGLARRGAVSHTLADVELTIKAAREVKAEIDALGPDELAARMAGKEPMVLFSNR